MKRFPAGLNIFLPRQDKTLILHFDKLNKRLEFINYNVEKQNRYC